jgi:hypothetical protein
MKKFHLITAVAAVAAILLPSATLRAEPALKSSITGTPAIKAINVIAFAPGGVLLIGDGAGAQLVAVETGDTSAKPWTVARVDKIDEKLAAKLGTTATGIEILHLAVNPASHTAYIAVRKQDDKKRIIMTVDGAGKIGEFSLHDVKHAVLPLANAKGAVSRITDVAWAGDRVLVGAMAVEEFASKVFSFAAPLDPKAAASSFSAETYHVSHKKWETRAPMTTLMPIEENGKKYVVGAFACTPVVRYPLDDLKPAAQVKGESVIELGSGNQPLNMFTYEKGGKSYILMNTHRFHHARKPFGPSPYWTVRIESGLVNEKEKINEKALFRLDSKGEPGAPGIKMIEEYHGVMHLDKLDSDRALTVQQDAQKGLALAALPLP